MDKSPAAQDADLLNAYTHGVAEADAAFTQLVARHGAMVYQTCLRIVGDPTTAEDAAQATFLVLAKKAGTVHGNVGAYLHGVASFIARRALDAERLRKIREQEAGQFHALRQASSSPSPALWAEVEPHLDADIESLPTQQRLALVMHYLEGRSQDEVAQRLGLARGTVAKHVQLGLEKLRHRLTRRGIGISDSALNGSMAELRSDSSCPAFLLASAGKLAGATLASAGSTATVSANVTMLSKGALQMMYWAKVKMAAAVVLAVVFIGVAVPAAVQHLYAAEGNAPAMADVPTPKPVQDGPPKPDETPAPPPAQVSLKTVQKVQTEIPLDGTFGKQVETHGATGFLVVRSKERYTSLSADLEGKYPHNVLTVPLKEFAETDFKKSMLLLFFRTGTTVDSFDLTVLSGDAKELQANLSFTLGGNDLKGRVKCHLVAVAVPIAKSVTASVPVTVSKLTKNADGTFSSAGTEYTRTWTIDENGGDIIDGLQGVLRLDAAIKDKTIAPGDDIMLTYELKVADPKQTESIYVWDNKYSNGYRNDGYVVVKPDGTTQILRRAIQDAWFKNIPTVIEIKPGKPWPLSGIANDTIDKSLKDFGLDTTKPGTYTIYGFYEETTSTAPQFWNQKKGGAVTLWGGRIATPPIQVTVAKMDVRDGEMAKGLEGCLELKNKEIQSGQDITFTFLLHSTNTEQQGSIWVYDNTHFRGSHNDTYRVTKPDGTTVEVFQKNEAKVDDYHPEPVEIKPGSSWTLSSNTDQPVVKSLNKMGVDISVPGTYTITGKYKDVSSTGERRAPQITGPEQVSMWGGLVTTPPIEIVVKAK